MTFTGTPTGPPPGPPSRGRYQLAIIVTVVVALLATSTYMIFGANTPAEAFTIEQAEIPAPVFEPKDAPGDDPFFPLATQIEIAEEELGVEILDDDVKTGLYGGTEENTCDPERMISFLLANPEIGHAWADVQGIAFADLPDYIRSLDVRVLAEDYEAINHGYRPEHGAAYEIDAILAAGTAVLVDEKGDVRARCYCGNPITPKPPTGTRTRCIAFAAPILATPGDMSTRKSGVPNRVELTGRETNHQGSRWLEISWADQTAWVQDFFVEDHRCPPVTLTWCAGPGAVDVFDTPQASNQTKVGELNTPINTVTGVRQPKAHVSPVGGSGHFELNGFVMIHFDHAAPSSASTAWVAMRDLVQSTDDCDPLLVCVSVANGIASRAASGLTVRPAGTYFVELIGVGAPASAAHRQVRIADGSGDLGWIDQTASMRLWDDCQEDPPPPVPPQFCVGWAPNMTAWNVYDSPTSTGLANTVAQVHRHVVTVLAGPMNNRYQVQLTPVGPTGWIDMNARFGTNCEPYRRCVSAPQAMNRVLGDPNTAIAGTPGGPYWATIYGVTAADGGGWYRYTKVDSLPDAGWLRSSITVHDPRDCGGPPPPPPSDCVAQSQLTGLRHWWTFDAADGSNDRKSGNHGVGVGNVGGIPAQVEEGARLAIGDRINYAPYTPTGAFTVDAWVRIPAGANPGTHTILDTRDANHQGFFLGLFWWRGQFWLEAQVNPAPVIPATSVQHFRHQGGGITPGTWHFVSMTVDPNTGVVLNLDGNRSSATPLAGGPYSSVVGGSVMSTGFQTNGWPVDGALDIDELEIFDGAVSDSVLDAIQAAGPDGKCREEEIVDPPVYEYECVSDSGAVPGSVPLGTPVGGWSVNISPPLPGASFVWHLDELPSGHQYLNGMSPLPVSSQPAVTASAPGQYRVRVEIFDAQGVNVKDLDCGTWFVEEVIVDPPVYEYSCANVAVGAKSEYVAGSTVGGWSASISPNVPGARFEWHLYRVPTATDSVLGSTTSVQPAQTVNTLGAHQVFVVIFDAQGNYLNDLACDSFDVFEPVDQDDPVCAVSPKPAAPGQPIQVTVTGFSGSGWTIDYLWTSNGVPAETGQDTGATSPSTDQFDYLFGQAAPDTVTIDANQGGRSFTLSCAVNVCPAGTEVVNGECIEVVAPPPPPPETPVSCIDGAELVDGRCYRFVGPPMDTTPPQCELTGAVLINGQCWFEEPAQ